MSKEDKLDILSIIEASPIKKTKAIEMFQMAPVRYFRWQSKYYLDNCLDDKRGRYKRRNMRLEDLYRQQIIDIRKTGVYGKYVIGPETIMGKLEDKGIFLSAETIRKILHKEGLIEPRPKVQRHEYRRFEAEHPNLMWQIDILHVFIFGYGYYYLFNILDDYSRRIMHWDIFPIATSIEAVEVVDKAIEINNVIPESILDDRGVQFYSGDGKRFGKFEKYLDSRGIKQILARVKHPQTLGKVERYHRTLRQECLNFETFTDPIQLRKAIRVFVDEYNFRRKHKGINRVTPHQRYSGEDLQIIKKRDELRKLIIAQRRNNYINDLDLQKEIAYLEVINLIQNSFSKEVVLV